ncbi:ATP-dependent helicase [Loigolactobacillus backii]|uniref:helicase C-terminal domain-containing protein n=1 Tax=Loigolactobacillus backii TaxID=375175 RepID=UPI0007F05136|nr:helicase C-terminal domain-containing protein [Loigolactobacillus backii]ANK64522.1 ATP-dependent helicase [Loigolactobacillus backii]
MNEDTIYAVVDLETTGTSVKSGDRIIQFGCVLVQHHKIINRLATDVNPEQPLPKVITSLTHLTETRLHQAPLFEDVAPTIVNLLRGCVFVAHNINFDYPFLNAELVRVGQEPLELEGVDTVDLAQILLPTSTSFKLTDLARYLNLTHDNPHQADSDALVTAKLFITLGKRLQQLPFVTQQRLAKCSTSLTRETGRFFALSAQQAEQHPQALPDYLFIKAGLALRKTTVPLTHLTNQLGSYPETEQLKKQLFKPLLKWRKTQSNMMDLIYTNYTQKGQGMLLEAATGLGKSLGYLLPFAYLISSQKQLVVSTATTILQDQFADQTVPLLNQLLKTDLQVATVKSARHYLDLNKFSQVIIVDEKVKQIQLLKMKLLVWLTMTQTGDLEELHLTTYQSPLFGTVSHQNGDQFAPGITFYEEDFLRRQQERQKVADVLVTNHAYLSQHATDFKNQPYLVIDEAQNFAGAAMQAGSRQFIFAAVYQTIKNLRKLLNSKHEKKTLPPLFQEDAVALYNITSLDFGLGELEGLLTQLQESLYQNFVLKHVKKTARIGYLEVPLTAGLQSWYQDWQRQLTKIDQLLTDNLFLTSKIIQSFNRQSERWLPRDYALLLRFSNEANHLTTAQQTWQQMLASLELVQPEPNLIWLSLRDYSDSRSLSIHVSLLDVSPVMTALAANFESPVYTGATLSIKRDFSFFKQQLGLSRTELIEKRFASPFRYKRQARLYLTTDSPAIKNSTHVDYVTYLASAIYRLTKDNRRQTLVLFNSLQMINDVYHALLASDLGNDHELFAQGVTGSRERITKRFQLSQGGILLGASSFWTGIDLPNEALEQLIMTRLPFDSPDGLLAKVRYHQLEAQNLNPFINDALPKATLRLRQGFGRLIRTNTDRGVLVILDNRVLTTTYGKKMLKALPTGLPQIKADLAEVVPAIDAFFKNNP